MGAVFEPRDVLRGQEWMLRRAARDLGPAQVEQVEQILRKWSDDSEGRLIELLGEERTRRLLKDLRIGGFR